MICRSCKREIPENSIFCCWCGEKQLRERKKELSVPKPRLRPSGLWIASMMVDGKRTTVSAHSEAEYYAKARALKAGLLTAQSGPLRKTVRQLMDDYIASREAVLSPSTIRSYKSVARTRWLSVASRQADSIRDWQLVVDAEAALCSPKTLKNAWLLLSSALSAVKLSPDVQLPTVPRSSEPWLTAEQIPVFLEAVKGADCELAALLALHSLRRGELHGLDRSDITDSTIHVHRTLVQKSGGGTVYKPTPKTGSSDRYVTIFIPRLRELVADLPEGQLVSSHIGTATKHINTVCSAAGLPLVGLHGLRRSFASLCHRLGVPELETMRQGGWSDYQTVHRFYIRLDAIEAQTETGKLSDFYESITTKITTDIADCQ